ncbi:MAG: TetR/AcrR family transcriptional regulator, partial [Spirochaetaceae bacterium]|jgi:AcrR family transcriptional regulator|nr:TetR/AcrR family transcriptional regulator [Spirochaetaceae bacterium]
MTQEDIVNAAFRVWGRELYKTTSLSMVAQGLGVTKQALYRHFANKEALLDAMCGHFFDHYAEALRKTYDQVYQVPQGIERLLVMSRGITEYYARNREYFVFFLFLVSGNKESYRNLREQLERRGISLGRIRTYIPGGDEYPPVIQMAGLTAIFTTALFHKARSNAGGAVPPDKEIDVVVTQTEKKIAGGLRFDREDIDALEYERLEALIGGADEPYEDDGLLKAVAGAVAEVGPWVASMDMVARRSGLSKSGLYAHFKSKQDMLGQLFMTEVDRIAHRADVYARMSAVPAERLYLAVLSIADYLRSRPEILIALNWTRIQRLDLRITVPRLIYDIFADIRFHKTRDDGGTSPETAADWILFLIVDTLMRRPGGLDFAGIPDRSIRILFRFLT